MYKIQNLTNRPLQFQGVTISAYGTASFTQLNDYVKLSQYLNSGKVRSYTVKDTPLPVAKPIVEAVKVETKVEETDTEKVVQDVSVKEPVQESTPITETEEVIPKEAETVETSVKEDTEKYTKGKKKSSKK